MLRLLIQTVLNRCDVVLLNDSLLLAAESWESNKDEIKTVLPAIEKMLSDYGYDWKELEELVVVVGKGNFSATRIGVTIANILALATVTSDSAGAKIYEMEVTENEDLKEILRQVGNNFRNGWKDVKLAKPIYRTEPLISLSKKKKFTE